jgi:hypothetical protein
MPTFTSPEKSAQMGVGNATSLQTDVPTKTL